MTCTCICSYIYTVEQLHKYEVLLYTTAVCGLYTQQGRNGCHYSFHCACNYCVIFELALAVRVRVQRSRNNCMGGEPGNEANSSPWYIRKVVSLFNVQTHVRYMIPKICISEVTQSLGHVHCVNTLGMYIHVNIVSHMYIHIVLCVNK